MAVMSLRQLAGKLNISHATVSAALRGGHGVKPSTRRKVLAAAEEFGYRSNPLASALMAEMRRSKSGVFRGLLAIIDVETPSGGPVSVREYKERLVSGAMRRAEELGFKIEPIIVGGRGVEVGRLGEVLDARGIQGVFLMPEAERIAFEQINWLRMAGIYAGSPASLPRLGAVCPDYHYAVTLALDNLRHLGYLRPGLVLDAAGDERLLRRWESAYYAGCSPTGDFCGTRPLRAGKQDEARFVTWCEAGNFDVILAYDRLVMPWLNAVGGAAESRGFCCLNLNPATASCAGLDLQPHLIGAQGMDMLTGQILRHETGASVIPVTALIPPAWIPGASVRATSN